MPTETIEAPEKVQEPLHGIPPSPFSNTMQEKLDKLLAPFAQSTKPEETPVVPPHAEQKPPEPAKPTEAAKPTEPPKPADKPIEPVKPVDEELPESIRKSPKASEEFKKVRTIAQQAKEQADKYASQIKALEGEIAKYKTAPVKPAPLPPEFEALKKEHEEFSNQLKIVSIERHPSFKSHFESRVNMAVEKAKTLIGPDLTDRAMKLTNLPASEYRTEQLDKLITDIQDTSPSKAMFLADLVRDMNTISYDRESALKKARDDYEAVQRHDREKAQAEQAQKTKEVEQFVAAIWDSTKDLQAFKKSDDPQANGAIAENEEIMKALISGQNHEKLPPQRIPGLAIEALYLREKILPALTEERDKLAKQIAEMTQSTPKPTESAGRPTSPTTTAGQGFVQRYLANKPQT
jgi:hypothetical protein